MSTKIMMQLDNFKDITRFNVEEAQGVLAYHESLPGYAPTPLYHLDQVTLCSSFSCLFFLPSLLSTFSQMFPSS